MIARPRHLLLAGGMLLLAACASGTHSLTVEIPATGDTLAGALSVGTGAQDVSVTANDGTLACDGVSLLGYAAPGCETSGAIRLQCTDGRDITGDWRMEDCEAGTGRGKDSAGNPVRFAIGPIPRETAAPSTVAAVAEPVPGPAAYRFRLGSGYVAGFGPPDPGDEPVFLDAETGLVIVKRAPDDALPMILPAMPAPAGEAFVLQPSNGTAKVMRVLLEPSGGRSRIAGDSRLPAGLPVLDAQGQVIGLTNGQEVIAGATLRGYLQLVAPRLLEQPVTSEPVERLRSRILAPAD